MKTLSIRQPWVELVLRGEKDVENRSWPTEHRGPLLLHASKKFEPEDLEEFGVEEEGLALGALVGVVEVMDCTQRVSSEWHEEGEFGWYLRRPLRFVQPIPYRGAMGLFDVPEDLVARALKSARPPEARRK